MTGNPVVPGDASDSTADNSPVRRFQPGHRWDHVELKVYKEDGRELFCNVTRQVLFSRADLAGELRYFEVAPGGFTTLERHEHVHAVLILRGQARVLVGTSLHDAGPNDLVTVPPMTWHQFRTTGREPMGFLCMVDAVRDKPQLPAAADEAQLKRDPAIAAYLSGD